MIGGPPRAVAPRYCGVFGGSAGLAGIVRGAGSGAADGAGIGAGPACGTGAGFSGAALVTGPACGTGRGFACGAGSGSGAAGAGGGVFSFALGVRLTTSPLTGLRCWLARSVCITLARQFCNRR